MDFEKEASELRTETQRLRSALVMIRRLEYVIPNESADNLILRAVAMARNGLNEGK